MVPVKEERSMQVLGDPTSSSAASLYQTPIYLSDNLQQAQQHSDQQQQQRFSGQLAFNSSSHHQLAQHINMDNSLHKQSSPHLSAAQRSTIPAVANSVSSQQINPLLATTSASPSLVHVSSSTRSTSAGSVSASAVVTAGDLAAAAAAAAAAAVDESLVHDDSELTLPSAAEHEASEMHDAGSQVGEESTRRVNLSGHEKLLLVKTFVDHEREFFDANVRNRDFWVMVNDKFSQLIDRPFKTARQAIYRYVKSAEAEEKDSSLGNAGDGSLTRGGDDTPPPGSSGGQTDAYGLEIHGSRRKGDDKFSQYVDRAVAMFQSRKEMKEKRIKRSTLGLSSGNTSLTNTPLHHSAHHLGNNGNGAGSAGSGLKATMNDRESPEDYQDSMEQTIQQYSVVATAAAANDGVQNPLSPTPSTKSNSRRGNHGDAANNRANSALLGQALGGQSASSSPNQQLEKRYLNPTDIYGNRKKFKSANYEEGQLAIDVEMRIQALEKRMDNMYETLEAHQRRFEQFTSICSQFFSKVSEKLGVENPLSEYQNFGLPRQSQQSEAQQQSQSQQQSQAQQHYSSAYQIPIPLSQSPYQQQGAIVSSVIHPALIQQQQQQQQEQEQAQHHDGLQQDSGSADDKTDDETAAAAVAAAGMVDPYLTNAGQEQDHQDHQQQEDAASAHTASSAVDVAVAAAAAAAESVLQRQRQQQLQEEYGGHQADEEEKGDEENVHEHQEDDGVLQAAVDADGDIAIGDADDPSLVQDHKAEDEAEKQADDALMVEQALAANEEHQQQQEELARLQQSEQEHHLDQGEQDLGEDPGNGQQAA